VALAAAAGMVVAAQNVITQRTQAPAVAAVLNTHAQPGDLIAFCPDQLGPSVYRIVSTPSHFQMVTFPRGIGPQLVDWVDYQNASTRGNSASFAAMLVHRAGARHRIWLAWEGNYQTFGFKCEVLSSDLQAQPGYSGRMWVVNNPNTYYEPMNLSEYVPSGL
jgi:mannosyltransferase